MGSHAEFEKTLDIASEPYQGKNTTASDWAKEELARAVAAGITDGTRPGGYAKREEVAAMVLRGEERIIKKGWPLRLAI